MNKLQSTWACLISILFMLYTASTQGTDLCDRGDVKNEMDKEKMAPAYQECKLQELSADYFAAANELVDVLLLLEAIYLASEAAALDEADQKALASEYKEEVEVARAASRVSDPVDVSTDVDLARLKSQVSLAHDGLQRPNGKISRIDEDMIPPAEAITFCQANFYWKKSSLIRKRINQCVEKAQEPADDDN